MSQINQFEFDKLVSFFLFRCLLMCLRSFHIKINLICLSVSFFNRIRENILLNARRLSCLSLSMCYQSDHQPRITIAGYKCYNDDVLDHDAMEVKVTSC